MLQSPDFCPRQEQLQPSHASRSLSCPPPSILLWPGVRDLQEVQLRRLRGDSGGLLPKFYPKPILDPVLILYMHSPNIFRTTASPAKKNVRLSVELCRIRSIFIIFIESQRRALTLIWSMKCPSLFHLIFLAKPYVLYWEDNMHGSACVCVYNCAYLCKCVHLC